MNFSEHASMTIQEGQRGRAELQSAHRIIVCIYSWYYLRHIRPALEVLADRGHRLHVISIVDDGPDFRCSMEELAERYGNITYQNGPESDDEWRERAFVLRQTQCWLQSQERRFDQACRYGDTQRLRGRQPIFLEKPPFRRPTGRELAWRALRRIDRALPRVPAIDAVFADFRPHVMIITPLIDRLGAMWDYMYSARAFGIRTVFPVHSWDNLSSKARLNVFPDKVLVWNETQRQEAIEFHRVPSRRIVVIGAQGFDDFFAMRPSMTRDAFCAHLGLRPDRPILLYVCSAILKRHMAREIATTKAEIPYFTRWITELRKSEDPRICEANIVIRPHPKRQDHWDDLELTRWGTNVVVNPKRGHLPNDQSSKEIFFDSLFHADVVMGLNTSAMIEAAIVGRPVMTVLDKNYRGGQEDMQHFQYLLKVGGGLLVRTRIWRKHVAQLRDLLDQPERARLQARKFTESFVRPLGLDRSPAPLFADIVLEVAGMAAARKRRRGLLDQLITSYVARWQPQMRSATRNRRWSQAELELKRQRRMERRLAAQSAQAEVKCAEPTLESAGKPADAPVRPLKSMSPPLLR
jgi:hypothetical protein